MKLLLLWEILIIVTMKLQLRLIGKRTLRRPIQSVITLVIDKLDSRFAVVQF